MTSLDKVQRLVEDALDSFDSSNQTVAALLRRCIRIANMRNDWANLAWLEMESMDLTAGKGSSHVVDLGPRMLLHMDVEEANEIFRKALTEFTARRQIDGQGENIHGMSVEGMEEQVRTAVSAAQGMEVPQGLHPLDLYYRSNEVNKIKLDTELGLKPVRTVLARIKARLYEFLIATERQLEFGQVNADVFERLRQDVDAALGEFAPEALAKFTSAARRANEGDPEALSQALTSCRRVLKATADAVYPPTGETITGTDGRARAMTDDLYMNRLLQAVSEAVGKHANGKLVQATLETVGRRVAALNELANKGVHADVTREEVDTCVVQTYLMVGDVLRLVAGRSGALVVVGPATE